MCWTGRWGRSGKPPLRGILGFWIRGKSWMRSSCSQGYIHVAFTSHYHIPPLEHLEYSETHALHVSCCFYMESEAILITEDLKEKGGPCRGDRCSSDLGGCIERFQGFQLWYHCPARGSSPKSRGAWGVPPPLLTRACWEFPVQDNRQLSILQPKTCGRKAKFGLRVLRYERKQAERTARRDQHMLSILPVSQVVLL